MFVSFLFYFNKKKKNAISNWKFMFSLQCWCCRLNVLLHSLISVYCWMLSHTEIKYGRNIPPTVCFGVGGTVWAAQRNLYLPTTAVFRNARWRLQLSPWKLVGVPVWSQTLCLETRAAAGGFHYPRCKRGNRFHSASKQQLLEASNRTHFKYNQQNHFYIVFSFRKLNDLQMQLVRKKTTFNPLFTAS